MSEHIEMAVMATRTMEGVKAQMTAGLVGLDVQAGAITDGIFAGQHLLLDGEPGLGKTELVNNLGQLVIHSGPFVSVSRLQGASDRQPADFLGAEVYNQQTQCFETRKGPIFGHFVLADEVNRNSTKTQAALHEAMAEKQVTIGTQSLLLPEPFMVLATQNNHEFGQGTSQMSNALVDRFGGSVYFERPSLAQRIQVGMDYKGSEYAANPREVLEIAKVPDLQRMVRELKVQDKAVEKAARVIDIILGTSGVEVVSPGFRSIQSVIRLAQANALRLGKEEATTEQIDTVLPMAMLHRIKSIDDHSDIARKQELVAGALKKAG